MTATYINTYTHPENRSPMGWYQCTLCRKRPLYYKGLFLCKLIPILYGSFLCTTTYGSFLCTKFPILYGSFLCTKPPIYMGPSYVLLHPFYIRWSLYIYIVSYVQLWVHLMYTDYCGVLLLYIRWSLYIERVIRTIMGPSYVQRFLWGLTPVHKMVPIIYSVNVLLWVHLMYTDYCGVLLLYIDGP